MTHAKISLTLCMLLIAGTTSAGATTIIFLDEDQSEHLVGVSVADTDHPTVPPKGVAPDAKGRYLVGTCGTVCPISGSYKPQDNEDSFTLTVPAGADPEAGNVYLTGFTSLGGDESAEEDNETIVIPIIGFGGLQGTPWSAVINSLAEGGGGGPEPTPEPSTLLLLATGGVSFLATRARNR